jgi:hypothetical protein
MNPLNSASLWWMGFFLFGVISVVFDGRMWGIRKVNRHEVWRGPMVVGKHARIIWPPWLWLPGWHPFGFWMQGKGSKE